MRLRASRTIALCSAANFINAADRVIMPIAIIPMTNEYHWSLYWRGWILSSFAFGYITSQVIGSQLATALGGKRVLTFAVLLWSASMLLTPRIASSLTLLIMSRVLLGLGEGIGLPTIFTIFADSIPVQERSRAFSYLVGSGTIGQTLAALLCPHLPWQWSFYSFGLLGLAWVAIWLICYTEVEEPTRKEAELPLVNQPLRSKYIRWSRFFTLWPLWSIYIAHFSMNWNSYIVMHWLPTYLVSTLGANKESISFTALPYIVNSVSGIIAGHWADSLTNDRNWSILAVRKLMTVIGLVGPAIFLIIFSSVNSLPSAIVLITICMALCSFNSAGHLSNHADVAPNNAGTTFAISNTIATIPGILVGPLTAELVTQSHGRWFPVFILASLVNLVAAVIYLSQSSAKAVL